MLTHRRRLSTHLTYGRPENLPPKPGGKNAAEYPTPCSLRDDDEDSRVMLVTLLRLAFIEAKAVGTAAQTLSLIQAEHFDLIMLDV